MNIFTIFKKKESSKDDVKNEPLYDEEVELKKVSQKIKNDMLKQRQQWDLAQMRLEAEQKRQELADLIEEQKDERYMRKLERKARIEELKQQLLDDEEEEDDDGEEMSADQMFFKFLDRLAKKKESPVEQNMTIPNALVEEPRVGIISKESMITRWNALPAPYKAMAKNMSDDDLRAYLINEMPSLDRESLDTAISVVRSN